MFLGTTQPIIARMDRLLAIKVFMHVAERQSFTAAADELTMSRQTVSDQIRDLEEHLGVRLLNRTTRRVALTESGAAFLEKARLGLGAIEEAEAEAASLAATPRGVLRVNAPMSFGFRHVAPAVGAFMLANPEIRIELTLNDRVVNLIEENVDVAIRIGQLGDSSLIARKLAPCRSVLCASPDYLKQHGRPKHPRDLAGHRCLAYAYAADNQDWTFERKAKGARKAERVTVRVQHSLLCNNGDALIEAAAAGAGVTVQPSFIAGDALNEGRVVALLPGWRVRAYHVHALYPPSQYVPAKTRAFIDHLVRHFAGNPFGS